ncbi:hypothetical protein BKA66DRAFT_546066 [Pyrenochaeta sp. MPI-SDFR-AT-0127]|nr:hypothetical protein BKA66DRAFT_546066 [Pyrenochaeta sp. MPI-SDFR-AT-0127]
MIPSRANLVPGKRYLEPQSVMLQGFPCAWYSPTGRLAKRRIHHLSLRSLIFEIGRSASKLDSTKVARSPDIRRMTFSLSFGAIHDMTAFVDAKRIRTSTLAQLRQYYKELSDQGSDEELTEQLLQTIERGLIPPHTFALWLGVSKSRHTIRDALLQNKSIIVRGLALKQLQADLRSSTWRETWDGVGGTTGVLEIFADLSVLEVRDACKVIGRSAKGADLTAKRECFTHLFKGLHPSYFPNAIYKTADQRPLKKYYGLLATTCSPDVIEQAISDSIDGVLKHARQRDLLQYHSMSIGQEQLRRLINDHRGAVDEKQLRDLCRHYPASSSQERGFSASMQFALTLLRGLVQPGASSVDDTFFINDLVRPLLKRAVRKRAKSDRVHEIVDLTVRYLELHPSAGKMITTKNGDILYLVAYCWARKPTLFEVPLLTLISHPLYGTSQLDELNRWDGFLARVVPSRRYALLRFGIQASTSLDLDVNTDLRNVKGFLTHSLLTKLGPVDSLSLFTRLRKERGDENLVGCGNPQSILSLTPTYETCDGDPELYHIQLLKLNRCGEEAETLATRYVERRKKQATSAPQPEQRGFYSKSALFGAIASGSLDLYKNAIDWSKRFIRDPLVFKEIHPRSYPDEAISLLSGIPEPYEASLTMSDLHNRVKKANSILTSMFDTACAALQEPSFVSHNWEGVLRLFFEAVAKRIKLMPMVRTTLEPSEDELYHGIWEPTISLLIAIEEKANQDGYERLQASSVRGILSHGGADVALKTHDISILKFLDELAVARNALWSAARASKHPTINTLPENLPRGLPIQHLIAPWILDVEDLGTYAPYLFSRTMDTLFAKIPRVLETVPKDKAFLKLMGIFADSYQLALQLYIPPSCEQTVKQERIQKAWQYAIGPLSRNRMSQDEAERFWRDKKPRYLGEWPPIKSQDSTNIELPLFSETIDSTKPMLWNPFREVKPQKTRRNLGKPTYVDLATVIAQLTSYNPKFGNTLVLRNQEVPPSIPARIPWEEMRKWCESQAIAAMLHFDTRFGFNEDGALASPFPSEIDARYPSLLLHPDSQILDTWTAIAMIYSGIDAVPSELLYQVTQNIAAALDAADSGKAICPANAYAKLHEIVMMLIIKLGECDRPSLAKDFIIQTILNRPNSSSWHRQLLKPSFLRRLSASDAKACFETFATQLVGTMQARQEEFDIAKRQGDEAFEKSVVQEQPADVPHIKVTTIKFFAELLRGTDFIGENHAVTVLTILARSALHIDVRLSIVSSLLAMLKTASETGQEEVLTGLGLLASSAGNLNEREPVTESDWKQAETEISLPEMQFVPGESLDVRSPILHALLAYIRNEASDATSLQPYVERIILPTIARLTQQTSRWVSLFRVKYGIDEIDIPLLPRQTNLIPMVLSAKGAKLNLLPRKLLEDFTTHIMFNIAPPPTIRRLNEKFKSDPALRCQPDVSTWLQLYGEGLDIVKHFTLFDMLSLLEQALDASDAEAITPNVIQENFLKVFRLVIANDTPSYHTLSTTLTNRLTMGDCLAKTWWLTHGKTTIEAIIAHVGSLRTREWDCDPHRNPAVLPETFDWRLLLLDYPWPQRSDNDDDRERKCKAFADQLETLLKEMSGSMYHENFFELQVTLGRYIPNSSMPNSLEYALGDNWVLTAIHLGGLAKSMLSCVTTSDLLRMKLAKTLVDVAGNMDDIEPGLRKRLGALVESWKACENEDIRRIGYSMEEKYFSTT